MPVKLGDAGRLRKNLGEVQPDADKTFGSREEAESARDRLNRDPPEYGYGPWYIGGPVGENQEWWVVRHRGVMAEEVGDAGAYEEAFRAGVEAATTANSEYWRKSTGIDIESVGVEGKYPKTRLAIVFRPAPSESYGEGRSECRFGCRMSIWPAEYRDPKTEAHCWEGYFHEYLGTSRRAQAIWNGPCDPEEVHWLT